MHDPLSVAHEFRLPLVGRITVWHVDPEADGSDDSCDWFGSRKTKENGWWPDAVDSYEHLPTEARQAVNFVWHHWRGRLGARSWYRHPRWHVRHWRMQIEFIQNLQRWLFSRCEACGRRFPWGYAPVSVQWQGVRPGWLRRERDVYHHEHVPHPLASANA